MANSAEILKGQKLELSAGTLRALTELQRADLCTFRNSCEQLGHSNLSSISLDLTRCSQLSSMFISELADAVMRIKATGKEVHVEVSPQLGKMLHKAHLYHLFQYTISSAEIA
jgi:ABC-type transporter Mla MlaB component